MSSKGDKRTFTVNNAYHVDGCPTKFSRGDYSGRYTSRTPDSAAKKALRQLCTVKNIKGRCTLYIEIRETTQGSDHKLYGYHVKRVKLNKPIELAGRTIEYTSTAKAVHIPTEKCKKSHKSSGRMRSARSHSSHSSKMTKTSTKSKTSSTKHKTHHKKHTKKGLLSYIF